ncbi:MAG: ABC transporter substrate-binding protein, partial [Treponema sp.]|nr:ABC transporter substrate-binding protein [Treponema sp.]
PPPRAAGPVPIDFMFCVGGNPQKATLELVDRFNKSQNGVVVEASYGGGYEDALKKLLAAIVAGDAPDVVHMAMAYNAQLMLEGHLEPLGPYFKKDANVKEADFVKGLFDLNKYNGEIYGLPFNCSNPIMYYNKDLWKQAGLDPNKPPVTWDELYEYGKKIHALGTDVYGFNIARGSGWMTQGYTWQFGGQWIAKDNSTVLWTEKGALDALKFMKKMADEGVAIYQGAASLNMGGKVGMWIGSTAELTNNMNSATFDLGVAVMPYAVKKQVPIGGGSLYISKSSPQSDKDAAWTFLKFMSSQESQFYWAEATGYQASSIAAVNSDQMKALWQRDPRYAATYTQIEYAVAEDNTQLIPFNEVRDMFNSAWDEVMLNKADPDRTMAAAQERANRVLAQYKK